MKFNIAQKIILTIYGALFIYFSIIHVPFKDGKKTIIDYDTIFSSKSNLDFSRLILIIVIITILTIVLVLLLRGAIEIQKLELIINKIKKPFLILLGVSVMIFTIYLVYRKYQENKHSSVYNSQSNSRPKNDSTTVINSTERDSSIKVRLTKTELRKLLACTSENALKDFYDYMKFYYPDWKIYGKPKIKEEGDCQYEIQFTTINPHIRYEKEVIIIQISFDYDYSHYYFKEIRGTLY